MRKACRQISPNNTKFCLRRLGELGERVKVKENHDLIGLQIRIKGVGKENTKMALLSILRLPIQLRYATQ
jgi:hypothetical protein